MATGQRRSSPRGLRTASCARTRQRDLLSRKYGGPHFCQDIVDPEVYVIQTLTKFRLQFIDSLPYLINIATNLRELLMTKIIQYRPYLLQKFDRMFQSNKSLGQLIQRSG